MRYFPNSIMQEMYVLLSSDSMLVASSCLVTIGEPINTDPNITPWVGIHRGEKSFGVERMNSSKPWGGLFNINVYHQEYSELPLGDVWQRVDDIEAEIISLVTSRGNWQLNGQVDTLQEFSTTPIFFDEQVDQRFITNLITLSYRIRL